MRLGLLHIGYDATAEEVHYFLKSKFNPVQIPGIGGEVLEMPGTTTQLTKSGFSEYIEKIAQWAAEYLGITIPSANESLEIKFE